MKYSKHKSLLIITITATVINCLTFVQGFVTYRHHHPRRNINNVVNGSDVHRAHYQSSYTNTIITHRRHYYHHHYRNDSRTFLLRHFSTKGKEETSSCNKEDHKPYIVNNDTINDTTTNNDDDDGRNLLLQPKFIGYQLLPKFSWMEGGGSSNFLQTIQCTLKSSVFLNINPTPEIIAIMTIYFVEGGLGLARLAQTYLLKEELNLGPAEMSALTGFFVLPWTIKPLYGFLSDGFPLFGYRRRSYLVVAGIIGALSYLALGQNFWGLYDNDPTQQVQACVVALLTGSACIAVSDVVADGIVVQRTREGDESLAGGLQSLCWGSSAIGGLLSAYFSGSLLEVMGPRDVFTITAVMPLLVATIALLVDEQPVLVKSTSNESDSESSNLKEQVGALWSAIKMPTVWKPALFLFLWQSTPTGEGAMLYFMTDDLGFGPEFLGRIRLVSAAASLVGIWVYQQFLIKKPIKDILFWASIISTPLGLSNLLLISHINRSIGIPDGAFVFGDDVALSILGEIAFLPTLVLAARICPPGVEAVLFATLMSLYNASGAVGTEIGALLTKQLGVTSDNFENLALLTTICNVSSLYPLFFIGWLDEVGSAEKDGSDDDNI